MSPVNTRETELERELQYAREEVQNILEEMQTSQEELKSTNEELQSTNEELQSTNEELTTSKEEMQSLNEELQTVNAELQSKVDDFSRVNNDMKNLLNSTDIATLFLDKELNIRRFTNQATKIFKLIKSDIGRPFTELTSHLIYPELAEDSRSGAYTHLNREANSNKRRQVVFDTHYALPHFRRQDRRSCAHFCQYLRFKTGGRACKRNQSIIPSAPEFNQRCNLYTINQLGYTRI